MPWIAWARITLLARGEGETRKEAEEEAIAAARTGEIVDRQIEAREIERRVE
jgi:hypothetical protein